MTLLRLFGVRVKLSPYFLVLFALLAAVGFLTRACLLFGVVFLHELAHVLAARRAGLAVSEVELLPFGGVARIDDLLETDPAVEAKVAAAGPLANAVLIGAALIVWKLGWISWESAAPFLETNAAIGAFNLMPALPLDGGRVYRAWWAQRLGFRRATDQAVRLSRACAAGMVIAGTALLGAGVISVSMIVVAVFVTLTAAKERDHAAYVLMRYLAKRRGQPRDLRPHSIVLRHDAPLKELLPYIVPQRYHIVWVVDGRGKLVGIANEADVIDALFQMGIETPIGALAVSFGTGRNIGESGGKTCGKWDESHG